MLPSGWVKKKVGDLFEVQLGKMLNQLAKEQNPQYEYLGNSDIQWGKVNTENLNTMFFSVREIQKFHLAYGDILMCEGGEVGRCAIWYNQKQNILYQKAIHRLRSKGNIIPEYFYGYMISIAGTKLLDDFTTKTSIAHLTQEKLLELPVIVPPLPEQKKIAQILSTWDKAITTTEQLIANSQQQKKALMQQLLTGKKRLLDENGVRFSGEWKRLALSKLIQELKKEKEESPNSIELLTVKLHYKGVEKTGKFPNATERGRPYFKRFSGELIIGRQNLHNGGIAIVSDECNGLIASNAISSFKARNNVDIHFTLSIMSTAHFRFTVNNLAGGTGQKEIGVKDLLSLSIVVPDFEEQQKIASVLSSADREIDLLQSKLTALKQEKKALMQQLLTGKRRVKLD